MLIKYLEISNFRKLLSVRVELSQETTLFVGANNSGKTSAMIALRKFLSLKGKSFETYDFTLCHWAKLNAIGTGWIEAKEGNKPLDFGMEAWSSLLPTLDLWLEVENSELHYVRGLIPNFGWRGGDLGIRLRFEPKSIQDLYKDFMEAYASAQLIRKAAAEPNGNNTKERKSATSKALTVWPINLVDFLERRLGSHFEIRSYTLDPAKVVAPKGSQADPQRLNENSIPHDGDPLKGLIRINDIPAQRSVGESASSNSDETGVVRTAPSKLSEQLRSYYSKHLDPTERPTPQDLDALVAIEQAQEAFDARLTDSFKAAFSEVEYMGYPGVTDPRPRVSTQLKAIDGLNHSAAITFEVDVINEEGTEIPILRLPENNNGLGYQNLISMIFRLLSFRDAWMRVGKASFNNSADLIEPLHLVLVEEPEAHLHAQVQQVFIRQAYKVLRANNNLKDSKTHRTQLIVSTHSSHVAHEMSFADLRYFRRLPAGMVTSIPVSTVINLSKTFGPDKETKHFVTRYLRAQHADLFFADAAILVEGPAEKMLLPNFIGSKHPFLNQCYITVLEIGGSHAHKLRPLIEELGLITLIVTDLDSLDANGNSAQPSPNTAQNTNNPTLKDWIPKLTKIDELYAAKDTNKLVFHDELFVVRVAYQTPISVEIPISKKTETAYPYTFEDAIAFENLIFFQNLKGFGLARKFRDAIASEKSASDLGKAFFDALKSNGKKAELALNIIDENGFDELQVPAYIKESLEWLEEQLKKKQIEVLASEAIGKDA